MALLFADPPPFDNSGRGMLQVPGFADIPLEYELPSQQRFTHGEHEWFQEPNITARELAMLKLIDSITDKASWYKDVFDNSTVLTWREEALAMDLISVKAWEWCLAELQDKARRFETTGHILVYNTGAGVCKADTVVSEDTRVGLIDGTKALFSLPGMKDGTRCESDQQVHKLVDPMLYPLVYGKSIVLAKGGSVDPNNMLKACGKGEKAPQYYKDGLFLRCSTITPSREWQRYRDPRWSYRFQQLPCEVAFTEESGTDVHITSYINNLHPSHSQPLYRVIERLISRTIEPWNDLLIEQRRGRAPVRIRTYGCNTEPDVPLCEHLDNVSKESDPKAYQQALEEVKRYWSLPEDRPKEQACEEYDDDLDPADLDEYSGTLNQAMWEKWWRLSYWVHPEPGTAFTFEQWKAGHASKAIIKRRHAAGQPREPEADHQFYRVALQDTFRQQGLQLIVRIESIELTPQNPRFSGTNWHVEGLLNEHVIANAMYVFDEQNVEEGRVAFRQETKMDPNDFTNTKYDERKLEFLLNLFAVPYKDHILGGYASGPPSLQELGSIAIPRGRLLAWPNVLHYRMKPFQLVDKNKPGHRSFIVLSLVDPHYRICSTRNVPPQRHDWWAEQALSAALPEKPAVPREVIDIIDSYTNDWPIGVDEGKRMRQEMIEERKKNEWQIMNSTCNSYNFNLDEDNYGSPFEATAEIGVD